MASLFELPLTEELVEGLEKLYPPKCPELTQSERDIFFYAGQQFLVMSLRNVFEHQKAQARGSVDDNKRSLKALNRLAGCTE